MKYQYKCGCGKFKITRGNMTRGQYAQEKTNHAFKSNDGKGCEILKKELEQSRKSKM